MTGSGFHFRFPRARVHRIGATGRWGITLSGETAPRGTVYAQLHDAGTVAHEMIRLQREATTSKPVAKPDMRATARTCPDCGRPTRPQRTEAKQYPGTVTRCDKDGRCATCWRKNKQGLEPATPHPYKTRQPDEPAPVPMTEAEVKAAMPAPRSPRPAPLKPVPAPVVTPEVREATAAYTAPATTPIGPHYLKPDADGDPFCACGWDPYLEADFCDDKSAAVTAVRIHLRKVRTTS